MADRGERRHQRIRPANLLAVVERLDRSVTNVLSPVGITALGFITLYYAALSYGFIVIAMIGGRPGLGRVVANSGSHPMLVMVGVPMISLSLIFLEAADLDDKTLLLWRQNISPVIPQIPVLGPIIGYFWPSLTREPCITRQNGMSSTLDYLARSISGGLMLPFMGYIAGRLFFKSKRNPIQRILLVSI